MSDSNKKWPFDQTPDTVAITSKHIVEKGMPILLVNHYEEDHSWGFQSGFTLEEAEYLIVSMKTILKLDPGLADIADLPPGWSAERESEDAPWQRYKDSIDDVSDLTPV